MWQTTKNIFNLGIKEIRSLAKDPLMMCLIIYSFTLSIYTMATANTETLYNVTIAIVDDDNSQLSQHLGNAFFPPQFKQPVYITQAQIDEGMDMDLYTFVLVIPPEFEQDLRGGNEPEIQLNADATRMSQAFSCQGYIQQIIADEIDKYLIQDSEENKEAKFTMRNRYNANLEESWFSGLMALVNNITMLAIILTGSALIREREQGTLEHLLVMPVTPFEIMTAKVWSMGLVVLVASGIAVVFVIWGLLGMPRVGSFWLYMLGAALHLFAVTSLGIFLACVAQNMPQLGMLFILVYLPMNMLSGGTTPVESMPDLLQQIMKAAPTTHFVELTQHIMFRDAGMEVVWKPFTWLVGIAVVFFLYSLKRFRQQST